MRVTYWLLYWLYLGSIERKKIQLIDLALLHVQQLEAIRAIVASAGEDIVTFNEYSKIETCNETAEFMFLYPMDEIIGQPFQSLLVPSDQNTCDTFLLTYRSQGATRMPGVVKEFHAQRKDGTVFPLTVTLTKAPLWGHRLSTVLYVTLLSRRWPNVA